MIPYEFRTISHGKTIWTVEHYCLNHADAFVQAKRSSDLYEVQVWQSDVQLVLEEQPCNPRAEELRNRIALYRGFLEGGFSIDKTEFYVEQLSDAEDELARLEVNKGRLQ